MDYYMGIEYILDDLYEESFYWDTLYDCHFFVDDAYRVLYLCKYYGYSYSQAIYVVLREIEEEVLGWV